MRIPNSNKRCLTQHQPWGNHPSKAREAEAFNRLAVAFLLCLGFICVEIFGAWISGSLSLLADAFHMLADAFALGFASLAGFLATRPFSEKRSFGYYRIEVLAALVNGLLLCGMAVFIVIEAYERWSQVLEIKALPMLLTASFGLVINIIMLWLIHPGHQNNLNLKAAFLHILGDTLSSVAVITGALLVWWQNLWIADLIASLIVAAMILTMSIKLVWDAVHILLEGTPPRLNTSGIQEEILKRFPEVKVIHDFHVWEITSQFPAMTAHLEVDLQSLAESSELISKINSLLQENYQISHTTLQIEPWARESAHKPNQSCKS